MSVCTQCGHPLGVGRFCTDCGHPVDETGPVSEDTGGVDDWRTGTAERPAVLDESEPTVVVRRPVLPPPVQTPNEAPRYPLYADEAPPVPAPPPQPAPYVAPVDLAPDPSLESHRHVGERPPRSAAAVWLPWVVGGVVLLLVGSLGIWLLLGTGDDTSPASSDTASDPAAGSSEPSQTEGQEPSDKPKDDKSDKPSKPGKPSGVSRSATPTVPATAPPNEDVDGNMVRYVARNMLDGVPETTWRMAGDGSGETLSFELPAATTITEVGMINGYAKTSTDGGRNLDWYQGNRRILEAEWIFDDGSTVSQDFESTHNVQTIDVDNVKTKTVQVRLVRVSAPGKGPAKRDYTAISEVFLVGSAG